MDNKSVIFKIVSTMRGGWEKTKAENKNTENPSAWPECQSAGLYQNLLCHE